MKTLLPLEPKKVPLLDPRRPRRRKRERPKWHNSGREWSVYTLEDLIRLWKSTLVAMCSRFPPCSSPQRESAIANRRDLIEESDRAKHNVKELARLERKRKLAETMREKVSSFHSTTAIHYVRVIDNWCNFVLFEHHVRLKRKKPVKILTENATGNIPSRKMKRGPRRWEKRIVTLISSFMVRFMSFLPC